MAADGSAQSTPVWPVPKFRFAVTWDSTVMTFQEVSGLDAETAPIEYRSGDSKVFSTAKMPGTRKYSNVTMKKGVITSDGKFWDWFDEIRRNPARRRSVTISLLDEEGKPTMVWTLTNAWPTKVTGADLKNSGHEIAVEAIEIAHEGLTIASA